MNDGWRRGGSIMDDSEVEIGVPEEGRAQVFPESLPAAAIQLEATIVESEKSLIVPSSGSSTRKIESNRRNAKKSTGPKTSRGKARSSWNSTRHGLLSKKVPDIEGQGKKQFARLLTSLRLDLEPIGTLEELLVEK